MGIDPGKYGAVGVITDHLDGALEVSVCDTPIKTNRQGKKECDDALMAAMLFPYRNGRAIAFLENVHSMPGEGVSSSFKFGTGFGMWRGILSAYKIPYSLVSPQSWRAKVMPGRKGGKELSLERCRELFPGYKNLFTRAKDDGRADALLIAEYGRMITNNGGDR